MLSGIAVIPSAPVMVPELAGAAAAELVQLREAVFTAAAALPTEWIAVGVGPTDAVLRPPRAGTFAGYGVDVLVTLSPPAERAESPAEMPLCALVAGWVRGQANPAARVEVHVHPADLDAEAAYSRGRQLRADIDRAAAPIGVLIVADGAYTLTPAAPGGHDPSDAEVQGELDEALAGGDTGALAQLPTTATGIVGRVAFQVLAGLSAPGPQSADELYRGAPYGVGYFAGSWHPAGKSDTSGESGE